MSAAMSYGSDLTGDIRRGPLCRADGIRVARVEPADGLQYWDHACPGAHALDVVELTVGARSTIKQSPPSATNSDCVRTKGETEMKKNQFDFFLRRAFLSFVNSSSSGCSNSVVEEGGTTTTTTTRSAETSRGPSSTARYSYRRCGDFTIQAHRSTARITT